ncbi:MAG: Crp/Fnr family transcriptional regulator [Alphaproteobacteria bacterium]|nr:Crp/Fnr family transcriptional regulator [Alphaproteobacteria bacterium]
MTESAAADRRAILTQHFLLAQLDESALDRLLAVAGERGFGNGQVIFQKGDPGTSMMAVLSGRVRISAYSEDGREIILNIVEPGQLFGEIALLDGKERSADATAMGKTALLVLDRRDFLPFLERNPKIAVQLIEVLCSRLRRTSEMVESIAFLDFGARLARLLLQMSEHYGVETNAGLLIDLKISQADLGNLIASTRESVNRQLSAWTQEGVIAIDHGKITILDREILEFTAQSVV